MQVFGVCSSVNMLSIYSYSSNMSLFIDHVETSWKKERAESAEVGLSHSVPVSRLPGVKCLFYSTVLDC